jgi:hypothetical protein
MQIVVLVWRESPVYVPLQNAMLKCQLTKDF